MYCTNDRRRSINGFRTSGASNSLLHTSSRILMLFRRRILSNLSSRRTRRSRILHSQPSSIYNCCTILFRHPNPRIRLPTSHLHFRPILHSFSPMLCPILQFRGRPSRAVIRFGRTHRCTTSATSSLALSSESNYVSILVLAWVRQSNDINFEPSNQTKSVKQGVEYTLLFDRFHGLSKSKIWRRQAWRDLGRYRVSRR